MRWGWPSTCRRGVTPVVATIILSAVVIAIGGAVWSYAQGAASVIANEYIEGTMTLLNEVLERFTVEHVSNSSNGQTLRVWIYNYGDVDILVDVYANVTGGAYNYTLGTAVASNEIVDVEVSFQATPLQPGQEVAVKVYSRRQNNAYDKYSVR
jgi:flagellin-like protein